MRRFQNHTAKPKEKILEQSAGHPGWINESLQTSHPGREAHEQTTVQRPKEAYDRDGGRFFGRVEECYVTAIISKPSFTTDQMVNKEIIARTKTGLYHIALLKWNGFEELDQMWSELKGHFTEAYNLLQRSGANTQQSWLSSGK